MKLLVLIGCIGVCLAEVPFNGYPASGWKPQGAQFSLPSEYGAPIQEQQPGASEIEITKENIEYAGQLGETTTYANPSNTYLPPDEATTTELPPPESDSLSVQGLPNKGPANFQVPPRRANFRQQPQRGNLRVAPQSQRQQFGPRPSEFAEFVPRTQVRPSQNNNFRNGRLRAQKQPQQINFQRQEAEPQANPAQEYGPPAQEYGPPAQEYGPPTTIQPEPETESEDYEEPEEQSNEDDQPAIAVSNASSGQYYILAPDNTLQRVVFMTSQTEDDKRSKGFTAQLRYAPVEPIRDPIYAYNEAGQLVRIYNRKK